MTGYGQSEVRQEAMTLSIEVRSVNHRYLDVALRYPRLYTPLEARIKQRIGAYVSRGRIELKIAQQDGTDEGRAIVLDHALAQQYYHALQRLQAALQLPGTIDLPMLMSLRDIVKVEEATVDVESLWEVLAPGLDVALTALQTMRRQEGAFLCADFRARLHTMGQHIATIRQRVPLVVSDYQQRLQQRIAELFRDIPVDADRLAQETVLFAERSDITEELIRLEAHIQAVMQLFAVEEPVGRKIEFLVQEMHREVNTIGSKSNDTLIAQSVVTLKSELERVREQIQNIE
jgi:uncharacterized protein (TIGR00255 family)